MPDPLQVLLLTSKLSPAAGGLAVSVPGMARSVDRFDDISVDVMGTVDPDRPEAAMDWGPRVHPFRVSGPAALQYAPGMAGGITALSPDLIDVQGLWTYPSLANLRHYRRQGKPYLVTPRGMLDPWARRNSRWKKDLAGWCFENAHLEGAHCLRATADMEAEHFRELGLTNPVAIIPNGLDVPALLLRPEKPLRRVLFLSRIHPKKGIDYLLTAWASLEAMFPGWELVIAGLDENGHEAAMKRHSEKLGLARVKFPGAVYGDEKQALYRSADLFVLPTHAENFGLVIAEALLQEVPVITTKNAPWSGLEEHACGWWLRMDQSDLTGAMAAAMARESKELQDMGARGRNWIARDFGWDVISSQLRELYHWAAGQGAQPGCVHSL
ncbi:glycosyltransferase [Pseudoruegeria sp. HB172150]|uniref:glycosyltransferase n=1 Tax=Pseudoruegeria sp. HB172150 TaxID=2721164 RepID=UPI001551868D|nr:glycosyltransferase [Pseudoruegeria sp. HB172150]